MKIETTKKHPIYVSKKCEEKHLDLLLIGEEGKRHYVFIKNFNTFMYDHTLHCGKKHFCCCCLQAFSTEEILKCCIKDCFKINCKQKIIMPKKGEFVKFKNYERKTRLLCKTYADFESILLPEDNGKQNSKESNMNNCQKHIACSFGCKLLCVDDKFGKPFIIYLAKM